MIVCQRCSTSNISFRRFCRECGTQMVFSCQQCGFGNMSDDIYCGGCGLSLTDPTTPDRSSSQMNASVAGPGKYSYDDISELIQGQIQKKETIRTKKDLKSSDSVSQDILDNIFDPTDSD